MQYEKLVNQLQELESNWRKQSSAPSPNHSLIRSTDNIQYFACCNSTAGCDLPLVITVGINYTQGTQKIPDQSRAFSKVTSQNLPLVEDKISQDHKFEKACIESFNVNPDVWKSCCLAAKTMNSPILQNQDFHLVMVNFSPWITNDSWASDINSALAADLLISPPHSSENPFAHLDDFYEKMRGEVQLWIGHGLDVVSSHFRLFIKKHKIQNWLLTANTSSGCKPKIEAGTYIKFKR